MSELRIRKMIPADVEAFTEGFQVQGFPPKPDVWKRYIEQEKAGKRLTFVAEVDGKAAGYLNLVRAPSCGPFVGSGLPEITDFNVLAPYRRQGIGAALMDAVEAAAAKEYDTVTIGVGMHSGYGSAQRMYIKRGYIPDGGGVWYQNHQAAEGEPVCNDDDLVLYFTKKLR